jgi:hypothetical protein
MWLSVKSPVLVSVFKEANRNFKSNLIYNHSATKLKTIGAHTKSKGTDLVLWAFIKNIYLMTYSL